MWLLRAVGPVHGQASFTFALEQKKTYSIGRGKDCAIRLEDNRVKPLQGYVIVADWDPGHPDNPPQLRWKSEPNKKGVYPSFKTINPVDPDSPSPTDLEQYDQDELPEGTQGCFLHENPGQGILLSDGSWFTLTWEGVSICYDKMRDESGDLKETLRRYCVSWTQTFETSSPPTVVLSPTFKNSPECNAAIVSAVRILTPSYLQGVLNRLNACWKKVADSQDSFSLPPVDDPHYEPQFDAALPNTRRIRESWLPDERRKTLFKGWKVMGLRAKIAPSEKRWLSAMGADWTEMDVLKPPLLTPEDFRERLKPWLSRLNREAGEQGLVVHFMKVKEELRKLGGDFDEVVSSTCSELGLYCTSGAICWGATRHNGVKEYIEDLSTKNARPSEPAPTAMPPPSLPPLPSQAGPSQLGPPSTAATLRPDFVPSTFPDETQGTRLGRAGPGPAPASVATVAETPGDNSSGESQEQRTFKKPLRKRAAGVSARKPDLFADLSMESPMDLPPAEQPSLPLTLRTVESQSLNTPASQAPGRSKLKRRAGAETQQPQFDFGFDNSYYVEQQNEEKQEEIRRLYEETKAETAATIDTRSKRPRINSPAKSVDSDIVETARPKTTRSHRAQDPDGDDAMIEDDDVMEDPMQRMLRQAREARSKRNVSTSTTGSNAGPSRGRTAQLASEEPEEVEPRPSDSSRTVKAESSPVKAKAKGGAKKKGDPVTEIEPTRDERFLTAITTASKKAKLDEMDEEFNNLRILKPSKSKVQVQPADHPDWNMVEGFDEDITGNFIQIVKLDLFRKDGGRKKAQRVDDGTVNFKKFKKQNVSRRDPLNLVIAAPIVEDAEMGEAYWPTQQTKLPRRTQASQLQPNSLEDEDEMPLLPRSKKKRLLEEEDEDDLSPSEVASTSAPATRQAPLISKATNSKSTGRKPSRKTRAASIVSDVSSVAASTRSAAARSTASRARGKKEVVEIQDSEDEVALDLGKTPATSGRGTGTRAGTSTGTSTRGTRGRGATSTLEGEPVSTRSTRTPAFDTGTTTTRKTGTATQGKTATAAPASATARGGRRRLVVDDDDDDTEILTQRGATKKRRL